MNLLMMLELANKPQPARIASPPREKRSGNPKPNNVPANIGKRNRALKKYMDAAKGEWVTTGEIAKRLLMDRGGVYETLNKWYNLRLVERRAFNAEPYHHKRGYEWKFLGSTE